MVEVTGAPKWRTARLKPPNYTKPKFKNTDLVSVMISKVLCNLPFSRDQTPKTTINWYIKIWKSTLKIKKKTRIR
jgi:hypothetical protein